MCNVQLCIPDPGRGMFVLLRATSRVVAYSIAKVQNIRCIASSLKVFWYGVWNGIWKKILAWKGIWNRRFLVWNENGMEENCQHGMWKNHLPFHSIPCSGQQYSGTEAKYLKNGHGWAQITNPLISEAKIFIRRLAVPLTFKNVNVLVIEANFFSLFANPQDKISCNRRFNKAFVKIYHI